MRRSVRRILTPPWSLFCAAAPFRHIVHFCAEYWRAEGPVPLPGKRDRWITELLERFGDHVINVDARVSLEWAGRQAPLGAHAVGRDDAGPLPTAALEGLMAASASAYDLELISSKAQVYRAGVLKLPTRGLRIKTLPDTRPRVRVCMNTCVNSCENPLSSVNRRRVSSLIRGMIEGR